MVKRRDLNPEEKALWRRVAQGLARPRQTLPEEREPGAAMEQRPRVAPTGAKPPPPSPSARSAKGAIKPADRSAEKRVRRGQIDIDATLDLHGHTQDSGRAALIGFLVTAQRQGARAVIVVTGQGRGGEGVLKRRFPDWLAAPELKGRVAGFAQAHRSHGGAGAFYVFLKRPD